MIQSAEEFKRWFDAPDSLERVQQLRATIDPSVLMEVAERFPECRADVAWRRDVPLELLAILRNDEDEGVRTNGRWLEIHPEDAKPWDDDPSVPVQLRLSDDERNVLRYGLREWGGPANCTEELAVAMGFLGIEDLFREGDRIAQGISAGQPQTRTDWTRALLATEIVFSSRVMGAAGDWSIVTGLDDVETFRLLRSLQRKFMVTGGVVGTVFGTRPTRS